MQSTTSLRNWQIPTNAIDVVGLTSGDYVSFYFFLRGRLNLLQLKSLNIITCWTFLDLILILINPTFTPKQHKRTNNLSRTFQLHDVFKTRTYDLHCRVDQSLWRRQFKAVSNRFSSMVGPSSSSLDVDISSLVP